MNKDKAFVEQMKKRVEKELAARETEVVSFWKQELDTILHKKPESLSAMQQDMQKLSERMENRLQILKRSSAF